MAGTAVYETHDRVGVVRISSSRGSAFDAALRGVLADAVARLSEPDGPAALLIWDNGTGFPSANEAKGAGPSLADLCRAVEAAPRPVMLVATGAVLGPAVDLALAAHVRFAGAGATFGYPEVIAGLIPEAGGTQRLPRVVGPQNALRLLTDGETLTAAEAQKAGLVNAVVSDGTFDFALNYLGQLVEGGAPPVQTGARRDKLRDADRYLAAVAERRAMPETARSRTRRRVLECVEAALLLPIEAGLALEEALRDELAGGTEAQALVYMMRAEAAVDLPPELAGIRPRQLRRIGILGGGLTGSGLAIACLEAGFEVLLAERAEEALEDAVLTVIEHFDAEVAAGRIEAAESQKRIERLTGVFGTAQFTGVDLAVDCVGQAAADKEAAFAELDAVLPAGAVLLTTARAADLGQLARSTSRGGDVLGADFFAPVSEAGAAELCPAPDTGRAAMATAWAFVERLGKFPVLAPNGPIGRRLLSAYWGAADFMLFAGASVAEIDAAMRAWGAERGPYEMRDLGGLAAHARTARGAVIDDTLRGMGKRFYRPAGGGPDPEVAAIIAAARNEGQEARRFSPAEIRRRSLAALVNAGAQMLADGTAENAQTVDLIAVHGLGLPRSRGGPMRAAEIVGLKRILQDLELFAADGPIWVPEPALARIVTEGLGLEALSPA